MSDPRPQSPIFVKTYDFLLWLIPVTLKFPKSQRFLLAERLSGLALDFYDQILEAVLVPTSHPEQLARADRLLVKVRLYVRLSHDLKCISADQYEHAARRLDEIGRLLGGWRNKQGRSSASSGSDVGQGREGTARR